MVAAEACCKGSARAPLGQGAMRHLHVLRALPRASGAAVSAYACASPLSRRRGARWRGLTRSTRPPPRRARMPSQSAAAAWTAPCGLASSPAIFARCLAQNIWSMKMSGRSVASG